MIEIIPAILAHTEAEFRAKLAALPREARGVHVDFIHPPIPPTPFPKGRESKAPSPLGRAGGGVVFESHLMVPDPRSLIDDCVRAGFSRVVVQVENFTPELFASLIHEWRHAVEIVPSLQIDTPLEILDSFAHELESVQLMGIATIGAQGRPFDARVIARVRALHAKYPHLTISVDGGVNGENARVLEEAGARRLVVGSALSQFYGAST